MAHDKKEILWYDAPAQEWEEALPIGNGHIGAMVYGRAADEVLALNDDTLWSGYPKDKHNPDALEYFPKVREKLMHGELAEAHAWASRYLAGEWTEAYLPLGDLKVHTALAGEVRDYYRELDIGSATATTRFTAGDTAYIRKAFVTAPDDALVLQLTSSRPSDVTFSLVSQLHYTVKAEGVTLHMCGRAPEQDMPSYYPCENPTVYNDGPDNKAMRFATALSLSTNGTVSAEDGQLTVTGATEILACLSSATSFTGFGRMPDGDEQAKIASALGKIRGKSYGELYEVHLRDYRAFYDRVELDLGHNPEQEALPLPQRMIRAQEGADDPSLCTLLFQYGRYLMISASRPGTTPTNLQGIWNPHLRAPWSSNYTININTEMNYWPGETCNLSECVEPLIDWMQTMAENGAETAKRDYGAGGWTAHHNSDIWAHTVMVGGPQHEVDVTAFAVWPMAGGWLSEPLWEHYRFTGDSTYLREKALPVMMGAARFFLDVMTEDEEGHLVVGVSLSPENSYYENGKENGKRYTLDSAPAMDRGIIEELFVNCLKGAEILGIEDETTERIRKALAKLPPYRIGRHGQLQEWSHDYEETEVEHRHLSLLYGLYPSDRLNSKDTPEIVKACEKTLERRGFDGTGWSLAWKVCLWARLHNGDNAHRLILQQLRLVHARREMNMRHGGGCYPNLLGAHPPFQIDGNYGIAAGIAEMLVQSHGEMIEFLPALPKAWKNGYVRGLRVRGGKTVDMRWENGELTEKKVYE